MPEQSPWQYDREEVLRRSHGRYVRHSHTGSCFYCGAGSETGDQVPPLAVIARLRGYTKGVTLWLVESCVRCNSALGDMPLMTPEERKEYIVNEGLSGRLAAIDSEIEAAETRLAALRHERELLLNRDRRYPSPDHRKEQWELYRRRYVKALFRGLEVGDEFLLETDQSKVRVKTSAFQHAPADAKWNQTSADLGSEVPIDDERAPRRSAPKGTVTASRGGSMSSGEDRHLRRVSQEGSVNSTYDLRAQ